MTPIDAMLNQIEWTESGEQQPSGELPHVTHSGVLEIAGARLRCYRLSDGRAIFDADDFNDFFFGVAPA